MRSKIIIYGGSSLINKYLFFEFYKDDCEFIVFCRDKQKVIQNIKSLNLDLTRFLIHGINLEEVDLRVNSKFSQGQKVDLRRLNEGCYYFEYPSEEGGNEMK